MTADAVTDLTPIQFSVLQNAAKPDYGPAYSAAADQLEAMGLVRYRLIDDGAMYCCDVTLSGQRVLRGMP